MGKPSSYQKLFSESEYDGSSILGVRSWHLTDNYNLVGLKGGQWKPGENFAYCLAPRMSMVDKLPVIHTNRVIADPGCQCGFYAYFKPKLEDLLVKGILGVIGVIQGYGKTTIGSLGFRCEKARILAMYPFRMRANSPEVWYQISKLICREEPSQFTFPLALDKNLITLVEMDDGPRSALLSRFREVAIFNSYESMLLEYPTKAPRRRNED